MIGLLQRVTLLTGDGRRRAGRAIAAGLLVLVGVERGDGEAQAARLLERLLGYRVFADADGRMNRSLADTGGGRCWCRSSRCRPIRSGTRPSFTPAAAPADGERLFRHLLRLAEAAHALVGERALVADIRVPGWSMTGR